MALQQEAPTSQWNVQQSPWRGEIRLLLGSAMIIFLLTVGIGIFNGQRIVQLDHNTLLTHVHAGTLGWITLSVFAISLFLFGEGAGPGRSYVRWLCIFTAITTTLYVLAFWSSSVPGFGSGSYIARAVLGVLMLLVILLYLGWVVAKTRKVHLGVAQLAVLGSLVTLLLAGLIGVLLQFVFALGNAFILPGNSIPAHASTMTAGYLVLIGMGLSEWSLMPQCERISRWGLAQITLFFLAGLAIGTSFLFTVMPLQMVNLLFSIVGVLIYIVRFTPALVRLNWPGRNSERFFAMSLLFVVFNVGLTVYLVANLIAGAIHDPATDTPGLLLALDHSIFVGVMTNAIFGLLHATTQERRQLWPWTEDILFWGMNISLVGFLFALISEMRYLERIFTPIMGLSILLGLLLFALRMRGSSAGAQAKEKEVPAI
ncbi:hypothetical protein [Ktedonospora formicarum]|uniref:Uncharacterized protein n=1 Tax=Ktedonospora formicarum TaxID=2778364 RepID=A0A8J3HWE6_9CHLR|nr:hypothetical protein [Ktedonospora formicarum]GHO42255.1 hypothetical protein KSX_04180 [Ktedonospora formicarum]